VYCWFLQSCAGCSSSGRKYKQMQSKNNSTFKNNCGLKEGVFYRIKKEVDGDTFWLEDGCKGVKIRLIGIDAPESKNAFANVRKEPFGIESTQYMSELLKGSKIRVEMDIDSLDQYGRTLAYCYTDDGLFLNEEIVLQGLAKVRTIKPNTKYIQVFSEAENTAKSKKKNIWSN